MTRASGRTWQDWVAGVGMVAVVLLGSWWWRAAVILRTANAQEASPYAGMVEIPGGSFTMGRDDGPGHEQPAHQMFLPTFYIDRNLVTVVEFATFVQAKGPTGPRGEMYLDVHDPDNRIQQRDGVWLPDKGFELHPVGDTSTSPWGETPNIAARLEGLAAPNTVVISAVTAQLVQRAFVLEGLGTQVLKVITEPMGVSRVVGPLETMREAATPAPEDVAPLVGRGEELGLMVRCWEQSKAGQGQVVLISGEAGIGKSALVETLRAHVRREGLTRVALRCSPYHTNSALYPVIVYVQQALRFARHDAAEVKLAKLEQALRTLSLPLHEVVTEAGCHAPAVGYWQQAGTRALQRSAPIVEVTV